MATKSQKQKEAELKAEAKSRQQEQENSNKSRSGPLSPTGGANATKGLGGGNTGGQTYVPGNPGVPTPTVQPFLRADQMANDATQQGRWRQDVIDIDSALQNLEAQTGLEQTNLEKSRVQSRDNVRSNTAAEGWVGSSVQDGDLFDIEATARLKRDYMQTNLETAKITAGNKKSAITDEKAAWDKALEQMKVENAAGVQTAMGPWQTEPTAGSWQPAGPGQQAVTGFDLKKGNQVPIGGSGGNGSQASQFAANQFVNKQKEQGAVKSAQKKSGATPY